MKLFGRDKILSEDSIPVFGWIQYPPIKSRTIVYEAPPEFEPMVGDVEVHSVASSDLFQEGIDDVTFEGILYKFKPGLSSNFVERHV